MCKNTSDGALLKSLSQLSCSDIEPSISVKQTPLTLVSPVKVSSLNMPHWNSYVSHELDISVLIKQVI